LLFEDEMIFPF